MDQVAIRAVFMRGGTSKAVMFRRDWLPADRDSWAPIFLSAMGSPDPDGRQLDGMGGGLSSVSKVCVVGPPTRPDADVDYTFGQVEIRDARVDHSGSCGSMASAVGPFAVDEGLVPAPADGAVSIRIHDTNTGKIIRSRFAVRGGRAAVAGDFALDGVAGTGAPVDLAFLEPGGATTGRLLPTGSVRGLLAIPDLDPVDYSFVDASNPCLFVPAAAFGLAGSELPVAIESTPGLLDRIERVRRHAAVAVGTAADLVVAARTSSPRIVLVAPMGPGTTLSGRRLGPADADIMVRMIARGQPNRAVPVTTALCLAVACRLPGSLPQSLLPGGLPQSFLRDDPPDGAAIRVAHPSGVWTIGARVAETERGFVAEEAGIRLTARRLFQGEVLVPAECLAAGRPATG